MHPSDPLRRVLHIDLTPSDPLPQPGESLTFDVRVTDDAGLPVRASLALDLVDKAVLSLLPRTPNAILDAFYGRRGLGVETASGLTISINRLVAEQLEEIEEVSLAKYGADDVMTGAIAIADYGCHSPSANTSARPAMRAFWTQSSPTLTKEKPPPGSIW